MKKKCLSCDWLTVYEDLSMDIKTDNATSSSPWQLSQKWNFSQYQRCLALPWAFTVLVQWKKSQLSWFRRPLFLCIGGGEDGAEYKLLQGYCPNSSLSILHTNSSATLLAGWGMGSKGAQQDKGEGVCVEGGPVTDPSHFPSIRKRLALFEHVFRRPLSHHAFRWQHWQLRLKRRGCRGVGEGRLCPKIAFLYPSKTQMAFYNGISF